MNSLPFHPRLSSVVVPALLALLSSAFGSSLIDALDTPTQPWMGTPGWEAVATAAAHDGVDAVQVTSDDDNSLQKLETMLTGPGFLTFWWQVLPYGDDEGDLFIEIDGIEFLDRPTDDFAWDQVGINLPAGIHTVAIILRPDHPGLVAMVDQAAWNPGQQLPAAVALGDPDGMWIQTGEWQRAPGEARDGIGDAARLQYPGERGEFSLRRLVTQPAVVRHWRKLATSTPDLYTALFVEPFTTSWSQSTTIVSGRPGQVTFLELSGYANELAAPATVWMDAVEIVPLTLAAAVDLPSAPVEFPVTATTTWSVSPDEADFRRTGSVEASGVVPHASAEMLADFTGPGLLTWSWRKWADYDESLTVSANGVPLGVFTDDMDFSTGFAHVARVLTGAGTNSVLWRLQWSDNPFSPLALDDVLFSPPAAAGLREAMDIDSASPLYATLGTPWTSQTPVTHDGTDALELSVAAAAGSRAALTFPVTGPGVLTWWWRTDLPDGTAFRLHRQGRAARTLSGNSGWRQEFLALRAGEEFVRWEVFPGMTPATPSQRVWLDQVSFVPQTITIAEALDAPGQTWLSAGNALAAALPAPESPDGTDALVLTAGHNADSLPTSVVTSFTGPGSLSFWLHTRHGPQQYGYTWSILVDDQYRPVNPPPDDGWTAYAFPIPAGTHTVRWVPNTGTVMTLDEVTYTPGDGYTLWAQAHIPPGQPAGHEADPDRDGLSNLLEYGFSTDPLDPHSSGVPNPTVRTLTTGKRVLEFVHDIRKTDIRWDPEISSDLTSWQRVPSIPVNKDGFLRTMHAELPDTRGFARVRVVKDW